MNPKKNIKGTKNKKGRMIFFSFFNKPGAIKAHNWYIKKGEDIINAEIKDNFIQLIKASVKPV